MAETARQETRAAFETEHARVLEMFTPADRKTFIDWLSQSPRKGLEGQDTNYIMTALAINYTDFSEARGIPKYAALLAARLASLGEGLGKPSDTNVITDKIVEKVGGRDKLTRICFEGFQEKPAWRGGGYEFGDGTEVKTDIAQIIDSSVGELLAERRAVPAVKAEPVSPEPELPQPAVEQKPEATQVDYGAEYEKLSADEKEAVNELAEELLDNGEVNSHDLLASIAKMKEYSILTKDQKAIIKHFGAEKIGKQVGKILGLRTNPGPGAETEHLLNTIDQSREFYQALREIIRWRMVEIEKINQAKERVAEKIANLGFSAVTPGGDANIFVDPQLFDLQTEAGRLQVELKEKTLTTSGDEAGSGVVGKISVTLGEGWKTGNSEMEFKPFAKKPADALTAVSYLASDGAFSLADGYKFEKVEASVFAISYEGKQVAKVSAQEGGIVTFEWSEAVSAEEGLKAMVVLGQGFLDFKFKAGAEKFPELHLGWGRADATEASKSEKEPEIPTDYVSKIITDVPPPDVTPVTVEEPIGVQAPAEVEPEPKEPEKPIEQPAQEVESQEESVDNFWKEFEKTGSSEPPQQEVVPVKEEPAVAAPESRPQEVKSVPEGKVADEIDLSRIFGEEVKSVPEAPKPIEVNYSTDIARTIREQNGVAEVRFGQDLLKEAVEETFGRIITQQAQKGPKPTVSTDSFEVDNGFLLKGVVRVASFSVPFSLKAGKDFNYINHTIGNIPTIPLVFSAKQRDELLKTVAQRVRSIGKEISQSLSDMVERPKTVKVFGIEGLRIEGKDTIAKFRGKVLKK